jgi:predicted ATPase
MKVESISIQNFKLFDNFQVSFKNETLQEVSNRYLIVGDNGTGKTTLLQAIALPLALATRQIRNVTAFDWIGFVPGRYWRWGPPRIELVVSFTAEEIDTTRQVADQWHRAQPDTFWSSRPFIAPGESKAVRLVLDGESCRADTAAEYFQFQGRYYALQLLKTDPAARTLFLKLPGLFWFDQFRNLGSSPSFEGNGDATRESAGRIAYDLGVGQLRKYLNGWKLAQTSRSYRTDYLMELENLYKKIFPGRSFFGVEPMPGVDSPMAEDFYFLLNDGHRTYDIVEMSAGEQAVFPILYEFVRQQIASSIVLIDEIDLNLHPPAAQLLVSQLPKIGPTCQFIFTTHSDAVSNLVSEDETFHLPGGSLCL